MSKRKNIKVVHKDLGNKWGYAYIEDWKIEIDKLAKGKKHLEISLHETSHLLFPDMEEADINKISIAYTNLLWKLGYRRVDNTNVIPLQDGKK